jgi:Aerotolerance regulator N-terminal/von Willebrand factor type A domain
MNFLNPLFLFGLAAASIPIVIHLFTRRQPREVRFPSLEFLSEVNQSEIRRLRLKQWLLLALRTLAVACIALAMARPALRGTAGLSGDAATSVVVLVDRSASMAAAGKGGAGSLVAEAQRAIEDLLTTLGPADDLLLVPYDQRPQPVTPRPSGDIGRMRAASQALTPSAHVTDHRAALEFAATALAQSRALNRELFWFSDFQSAGFAGAAAEPAAPDGPWAQSRVYLVPLEPRSHTNVALADAALAPTETGLALSVTGVAFGATPGDLAVDVHPVGSEEDLGRGFLNLPERGEAATLLPLARLPEQGGEARIPDDVLQADNRRVFAAGASGLVRVVLREDGGPSPLRLALEAGSPASGLAVEPVAGGTLASRTGAADVVVVNDVERLGPSELQALLDFHRAGGGVLIALGNRADASFWNSSVLREMGAGELGTDEETTAGSAWRLTRAVPGHPVLAGFPARPGEPLTTARFSQTRAFRRGARARTLLEFDRAHPVLLETPHALVFTAPLDANASDFAVSGAFLPLFHQAVKVLARGTAASSLVPGDRYRAPATTGAWRIEDERGTEVPSQLVAESGATRLESAPIEHPGLYRVLQGGAVRSTFAVNLDVRESDLASVPEPALVRAFPGGRAQIMRPGADFARRVREARYGRELWSWFVIAALVLLVAETVIGRWGMGSAIARPQESARRAS